MAKVFGHDDVLIGLRCDEREESAFPIPEGMVVVEFDLAANNVILARLMNEWNDHTLEDGVLLYHGQPVIFEPAMATAPDGGHARSNLQILSDRLAAIESRVTALSVDHTAAQSATTIAALRPLLVRALASELDRLQAERDQIDILRQILLRMGEQG